MASFRTFVPGLSHGRPLFPSMAVHMGFEVSIAARGHAFLRVLWFSPVCYYSTIAVMSFSFIYHRRNIAYTYI